MKKGLSIRWVLVLLTAIACGSTPTPAPATPVPTTPEPATAVSNPAVPSATPVAAATAAASASPAGDDITQVPAATVAAGEVVKLSGDSFTTSDPFRFNSDTTLDVAWNYTGTAPFALWLVNVSEDVTDPQYDRILIDDVTGPHTGSTKTKIIAGDWTVQVEQADGPWTVEFKPES